MTSEPLLSDCECCCFEREKELTAFFQRYDPARVPTVSILLSDFCGNLKGLNMNLMYEYCVNLETEKASVEAVKVARCIEMDFATLRDKWPYVKPSSSSAIELECRLPANGSKLIVSYREKQDPKHVRLIWQCGTTKALELGPSIALADIDPITLSPVTEWIELLNTPLSKRIACIPGLRVKCVVPTTHNGQHSLKIGGWGTDKRLGGGNEAVFVHARQIPIQVSTRNFLTSDKDDVDFVIGTLGVFTLEQDTVEMQNLWDSDTAVEQDKFAGFFGTLLGRKNVEAARGAEEKEKQAEDDQSPMNFDTVKADLDKIGDEMRERRTTKKVWRTEKERMVELGHPRHAGSAYMFYIDHHRDGIIEKNPDMKLSEVANVLGADWNKLTETEKKEYTDMSAEAKARYDVALKKFKNEHPEFYLEKVFCLTTQEKEMLERMAKDEEEEDTRDEDDEKEAVGVESESSQDQKDSLADQKDGLADDVGRLPHDIDQALSSDIDGALCELNAAKKAQAAVTKASPVRFVVTYNCQNNGCFVDGTFTNKTFDRVKQELWETHRAVILSASMCSGEGNGIFEQVILGPL